MAQTCAKPEPEIVAEPVLEEPLAEAVDAKVARERTIARLRLLWDQRQFLFRITGYGFVAATLITFVIPKRYESTARLMPPESQSSSGMAMLAALSARAGSGVGALAGDFLGLKSSGTLFVGILQSRTVADRLISRFNLRKEYGVRRWEDARKELANNSEISEDRKSGIITIQVTDKSSQRAAAMAQAYVDELNRLVVELTTSSAHRERVFLEGRLQAVKQDLESAEKEFSQFASKNTAINIPEQGKAMVEAAASLQGHLIATQSELEGLRQIYTDNNGRVRAVRGRIAELQHQLEKLRGKVEGASADPSQGGESLYPSIRKLPLLGVTYADLYRRTKIQETVFETLTQEYELAKVEEAKEIPTVRVLDPANVPEKKSFPPRLIIICLGTFLWFGFAVFWVFGRAHWVEADPQDPGRLLAQEVLATLKAQKLRVSRNGSRLGAITSKFWSQLRRRQSPRDEDA